VKKRKKSKEITELPPVLPGMESEPGHYDVEFDLVVRGYAACVYARKEKLTDDQKTQLFELFRAECRKCMRGIHKECLESLDNMDSGERIQIYREYDSWCSSVAEWVREGIFARLDIQKMRDLLDLQLRLIRSMRLLDGIKTENLKKRTRQIRHRLNKDRSQGRNASQAEPVEANRSDTFVPTAAQKRVLDVLEKRALTTDALSAKAKVPRRSLFRSGEKVGVLTELVSQGLVKHHRRVGYYRPDVPPLELQSQGQLREQH